MPVLVADTFSLACLPIHFLDIYRVPLRVLKNLKEGTKNRMVGLRDPQVILQFPCTLSFSGNSRGFLVPSQACFES